MDIEEAAEKTVEQAKLTVEEASRLMAQMNALRAKLNIKAGAGRRFLKKAKPDLSLLRQAEKEINSQYSGQASTCKKKPRNKMMNALLLHGRN